MGLEFLERYSSGNGNDQMMVLQLRRDFAQHARNLVWFYSDNQDRSETGYFGISFGALRADSLGESGAREGADIAGDDVFFGGDPRADESTREGGSHFPGAQKPDCQIFHVDLLSAKPHEAKREMNWGNVPFSRAS